MEVLEEGFKYHIERVEVEGTVGEPCKSEMTDQTGLTRYTRLPFAPASQGVHPRSSFHHMECPAGVAGAWTLACKGLVGERNDGLWSGAG